MGNLTNRNNAWYIDGTDKINHGDRVKVKRDSGQWDLITIEYDTHRTIWHEAPAGPILTTDWVVERLGKN